MCSLSLSHSKHILQDADGQLELTSCVGLENGKVVIEEPLDSLLSCVSWILLLQSHGQSENSSDASWTCFGFSLSQDEVFLLMIGAAKCMAAMSTTEMLINEVTAGWKKIVLGFILHSITEDPEAFKS